MNWKGYGRNGSWPNFRYYTVIFLEVLRKTTKNAVRIAGLRAEILIPNLPNMKQEFQPLDDDARRN
jgi:hypothetical protein